MRRTVLQWFVLSGVALGAVPTAWAGPTTKAVTPQTELCRGKGWVSKCPASEKVAVRVPHDNEVVHNLRVPIVADVAFIKDLRLRVSVDGKSVPFTIQNRVEERQSALHAVTAVADYGEHKLTIESIADDGGVEAQWLTSFFVADALSREPPKSFRETAFHSKGNQEREMGCSSLTCHSLVDDTRKGMDTGACTGCHAKGGEFQHGPAGNDDCTECHTRTKGGNIRLTAEMPKLCVGCHREVSLGMKKAPRIHGPSQKENCSLCHDPHGNARQMLTRRGRVGTCVYCHPGFDKQPHVVAAIAGQGRSGHPVQNEPNKEFPAEEIACGSCHNPHFAAHEYQFAYMAEKRQDLCKMCHGEKF